jgi:hypothetical protein
MPSLSYFLEAGEQLGAPVAFTFRMSIILSSSTVNVILRYNQITIVVGLKETIQAEYSKSNGQTAFQNPRFTD